MVQTNQVNVAFNYQNISEDFFIFKFETNSNLYNYSFIDKLKQSLKTVAVVYLKGKSFFALFSKKDFTSKQVLCADIEKTIGNKKDILWKHIENLNSKDIDKKHLAQLLLNLLSGIRSYNNITGKLYYVLDSYSKKHSTGEEIVWAYRTIEFNIDYYQFPEKLALLHSVKTFTNVLRSKDIEFAELQPHDYSHFEINPTTRKMIRVPYDRNSKNTSLFIPRTAKNDKNNNIDFLDFSNWTKFKVSKCGILYKFKQDFETNLSKYFTKFEFMKLAENENELTFNKGITQNKDEKIKKFYEKTQILINIDAIKDKTEKAKAKQLAETIIAFLTDTNKNYKILKKNISIGKIDNNAINFRIIHNKKHYKNKQDPKKDFVGKNLLIQHITLEDFAEYKPRNKETKNNEFIISTNKAKTSSPALDNLFKELYIKKDIINGKISLVDWQLEEWEFIIREELEIDKNNKKDIFHQLLINKKGELQFESYRNERKPEYRNFKAIYNEYSTNYKQKIDGIIISKKGDINVILRTELHTLPDFEKIGDDLKKKETENSYLTSDILELIDGFYQKNKAFLQENRTVNTKGQPSETFLTSALVDGLKYSLSNFRSEITKEEINTKLTEAKFTGGTGFRKMFTSYFEEMTEDVLATFFKDQSIRNDLFSSNIGIWYKEGLSNKTKIAMYYVGKKTGGALQQKINKASVLRKIIAYKGDLVFEKLLPTMNVDFVKNGELTVIPYPFKYLRENIKLQNI